MNKKYLKGLVEKAAGEGGRSFRVIMSTGAVDRAGETVNPDGWTLENFMKNPVVLWAHDYRALPIAKLTNVFVNDEKQLIGEGEFAPEGMNTFADQVYKLFVEGFINAVSVGFIPLEMNGINILKQELLELSFVPVPANQEALRLALAKGIEQDDIDHLFMNLEDPKFKGLDVDNADAIAKAVIKYFVKTVVPYGEEPVMEDREAEWNEAEAAGRIKEWATDDEDEVDESKLVKGYAWFSEGNYLLLHHDIVDGQLVTHWQGVIAAMGKLLSDDGGGVPEEDRQAVYDHLASHYKQYGEEPPKYDGGDSTDDDTEDQEEDKEKAIKEVVEKAGRVLSEKNRNLIRSAVTILQEAAVALKDLLEATEPSKDGDDAKKDLLDNEAPAKASEYGSNNQDQMQDAQQVLRLANNITNLILANFKKEK